jgi:hypothetical protein
MIKSFNQFINESRESDYIDSILDKISKVGMDKLSKQEQDILSKYSTGADISSVFQTTPVTSNPSDVLGAKPIGYQQPSAPTFEVADEVILINNKKGNLPNNVYDFLLSKPTHIIQRINERGKIDIGARMPDGEAYLFNASRFALKNSGAHAQPPVKKGPQSQAQEVQEPMSKKTVQGALGNMKKNFVVVIDVHNGAVAFLDARNQPLDVDFVLSKFPVIGNCVVEESQILANITVRPEELMLQLKKQGFLFKLDKLDRFL